MSLKSESPYTLDSLISDIIGDFSVVALSFLLIATGLLMFVMGLPMLISAYPDFSNLGFRELFGSPIGALMVATSILLRKKYLVFLRS